MISTLEAPTHVSIDHLRYPAEYKEEIDPLTGQPRKVLMVYGVEVLSRMPSESHPTLAQSGIGVDDNWMQLAAETFRLGKLKGKTPELLLGHNKDSGEAPSVGSLENMRYERPYMVADLRVTNPEAQAAISRGELRHRSAEFSPQSHHIWGLSLTRGEEGHFEEEWPDLLIRAGGNAVNLSTANGRVCLAWRPNTKHEEMKMIGENGGMPPSAKGGADPQIMEMLAAIISSQEQMASRVSALEASNSAEAGMPVDAMKPEELDEDEIKLVEDEVATQTAQQAIEGGTKEEEAMKMAQFAYKDKAKELLSSRKAYTMHLARRAKIAELAPEVCAKTGMDLQTVKQKLSAARDVEGIKQRAMMLSVSKPEGNRFASSGKVNAENSKRTTTANADLSTLRHEVDQIVKLRGCSRSVALAAIKESNPQLIEAANQRGNEIYRTKQTRPVRARG